MDLSLLALYSKFHFSREGNVLGSQVSGSKQKPFPPPLPHSLVSK